MRKISVIIIALLVFIIGLLSGCNTTRDNSDFQISLHDVNVFYSENYVEVWLYLNINHYQGEHFRIGSLKYTIDGNSHYVSGGEIYSVVGGYTTFQSAFQKFEDTFSLEGLTINSELNNTLINTQPISWSVSGELTIYGQDNAPILIPFDGLTYNMTEYS